MRFLYNLDGALWIANGVLWISYAHVPFMGACSFAAAIACFILARRAES
jgi:hypothetical protein